MKVKKDNRVLTVDEADKAFYLQQGYDAVEFNADTKEYEIIATATAGKTYSIAEFEAMKSQYETKIAELEQALAERTEPPAGLSRDKMMTELKAAEVEFKGNISNEKLTELYVKHIEGDGE